MKRFKFLSKSEYTEADVEYYETDEFEFVGVTPVMYSPITFEPTKFLLLRHRETGSVIKGNVIDEYHPLWNHHEGV